MNSIQTFIKPLLFDTKKFEHLKFNLFLRAAFFIFFFAVYLEFGSVVLHAFVLQYLLVHYFNVILERIQINVSVFANILYKLGIPLLEITSIGILKTFRSPQLLQVFWVVRNKRKTLQPELGISLAIFL